MNKADKQTCYAWLGHPQAECSFCKGTGFIDGGNVAGPCRLCRATGKTSRPPLDFNTAFTEGIPKLASKGIHTAFLEDEKPPWTLFRQYHDQALGYPTDEVLSRGESFWEALIEYLHTNEDDSDE